MPVTVVVTGASSGIGRATAHAFARTGASLGLIARSRERLERAKAEVESLGGRALVLPLDVTDEAAVEAAADRVEQELGPIDVWVNGAAVPIHAPFLRITPEEFRRVVDVAFYGTVHGTRAALRRMVARDRGSIIQIASAEAYRPFPLHSPYGAAKHAVRGFSDALRAELMHDGSHVHIGVVNPASINTPFFTWGRTRTQGGRAKPVPPIYAPELVAEAVRLAVARRRREVFVGDSAVAVTWGQKLMPGVMDRLLARMGYAAQQRGDGPVEEAGNLFDTAREDYGVHGKFGARTLSGSPQVWMTKHRALVAAGVGAGLAAYLLMRRAGRRASPPPSDVVPHGRRETRAWYSDRRPGPDGRMDQDTLADEASESSFPASDPPAHMTSVIPGRPAR